MVGYLQAARPRPNLAAGDPPKGRLSQDQLEQLAAIAISRF
jgi:hypothetical protein